MRGHGHDRPGAVAHHDIVGDKNRDLFPRDGVYGRQSINPDPGLVLDKLRSLELGLFG